VRRAPTFVSVSGAGAARFIPDVAVGESPPAGKKGGGAIGCTQAHWKAEVNRETYVANFTYTNIYIHSDSDSVVGSH